jgi:nucleoside-diphosphate-sugar epimerase
MGHRIFITGAAGYIGFMLVEQFAKRADVETIIALDKEPMPEGFAQNKKVVWVTANTADEDKWWSVVEKHTPTVVVHAAWQIREIYANRPLTWKWNIDGSDKVFDFVFTQSKVQRLVYFSTVASYGAFEDNSVEHRYREDEPFRKSEYLYAEEKRVVEEHLKERYEKRANKDVSVAIIRPAAITGPRGRFMRIRFGLQAALSGMLEKSFVERLISNLVSFVPVTPTWLRQFIHEDDVVGIVERLVFGEPVKGYEVFNICPPGPVVRGNDMASAVGKRVLPVSPWMVRTAFFLFWHLTRGKVPTSPGAWRGYSYPIAVDGSKVTKKLGYVYKYEGYNAFKYTNGEYERFVPEAARRHNV